LALEIRMKLTLCLLTAAALAGPVNALEGNAAEEKPAPAAQLVQPPAQTALTTPANDSTAPTVRQGANPDGSAKIVWHTNQAPENSRDARTDLGGGVMISTPGTFPRATGPGIAIAVPNNTMGPGSPLWLLRDRENAARRIEEAKAMYAQRQAEMAHLNPDAFRYGDASFCVVGGGWEPRHFESHEVIVREDPTVWRRTDDRFAPRREFRQGDPDRAAPRLEQGTTPPTMTTREQEEAIKKARDAEPAPK
jgi:hypothetical protein